jgi:hypothetical protein
MVDILHQLLVIFIPQIAAQVVAGIERETDPWYVIAEVFDGVGVFAEATDLAFDADSDAAGIADLNQSLQMFYFLIEGGAVFPARDGEGDDFGGFGQVANFFESLVERFSLSIDLDAITADLHPVRISHQADGLVEIFDKLGRLNLLASIVEHDFHGDEFEIV